MERLGRPGLPVAKEVAKVLDGHLNADIVSPGHVKDGVDASGLLGVISAALLVLHVEKVMAEPQADIIAPVFGEVCDPLLHASKGFLFIAAVRRDHVQSDWNEWPAVCQLEIATVARADAHVVPDILRAVFSM